MVGLYSLLDRPCRTRDKVRKGACRVLQEVWSRVTQYTGTSYSGPRPTESLRERTQRSFPRVRYKAGRTGRKNPELPCRVSLRPKTTGNDGQPLIIWEKCIEQHTHPRDGVTRVCSTIGHASFWRSVNSYRFNHNLDHLGYNPLLPPTFLYLHTKTTTNKEEIIWDSRFEMSSPLLPVFEYSIH